MTTPLDQLPDVHAALRQRLADHLSAAGGDALAMLAARVGLGPHALDAFRRGAGLAAWAAETLRGQLDQAQAEREGTPP